MRISLPDVNVLIALAWPTHVHHRHARRWFDAASPTGWATCPFTQAGFVRISSNPKIITDAVAPQEAIALLQQLVRRGAHQFWPDDLDLTADAEFPSEFLMGHRQITDACLLGLAIRRNGKLVTLDQSVGDLLPSGSPHRGTIGVLDVT